MLQINVNGLAQSDPSGPKNWGQLLDLLEGGDGPSRQIVTAVRFAGVAVPTFREPGALGRSLEDARSDRHPDRDGRRTAARICASGVRQRRSAASGHGSHRRPPSRGRRDGAAPRAPAAHHVGANTDDGHRGALEGQSLRRTAPERPRRAGGAFLHDRRHADQRPRASAVDAAWRINSNASWRRRSMRGRSSRAGSGRSTDRGRTRLTRRTRPRCHFHVAAGPRVGFGHLMRARALARCLDMDVTVSVRGGRAAARAARAIGARGRSARGAERPRSPDRRRSEPHARGRMDCPRAASGHSVGQRARRGVGA